jgi:hypothetical protein
LFGEKAIDVDAAIKSVEALLPMSDRYRELLVRFGGAIMFENGAKFIPDERSPLDGKDGYQSLDILYGLGSGRDSIERYAATYEGEVPPSFVPIGGAPGGNQICMDSQGAIYLWDHESNRDEGFWRIAASMDAFLDRLEPDDD